MARKQVGAIDANLLARVDEFRGDVPRTRFVERALEAALGSSVPEAEKMQRPSSAPVPPRASAAELSAAFRKQSSEHSAKVEAELAKMEVARPSQTYRCPAGHPFPKPPTSPSARCPACSRVVVPA
jgi:hypothetical protein